MHDFFEKRGFQYIKLDGLVKCCFLVPGNCLQAYLQVGWVPATRQEWDEYLLSRKQANKRIVEALKA